MRLLFASLLALAGCSSPPGNGAVPVPVDLGGCAGTGCQVTGCSGGADTVLVGTVFAPNGVDPVPNATVYVPASSPAPFSPSVGCDLCGNIAGAVTSAVTRADGGFRLTGVPVGDDVPVVVELGRFRRVTHAKIVACTQNLVPKDPDVFGVRLPRKDADLDPGDHVPRIAVATGDYDQVECVLARMGLTQLDLYSNRYKGTLPDGTLGDLFTLLADKAKLKTYNLVVLNCTDAGFEARLTPEILANLEDYVASGGRLYATDWAYDFIHQVPQFAPYLCFVPGGVNSTSALPAACAQTAITPGSAHSTTPWSTGAKILDATMKSWLATFPDVLVAGQVAVAFNFVVINRVGDAKLYPTTTWLEGEAASADAVALPMLSKGTRPMTVTFDYKQCGRVHYSTYNTEPAEAPNDIALSRYPTCDNRTTFNPQERLLEYLIFETAQCVGPIL